MEIHTQIIALFLQTFLVLEKAFPFEGLLAKIKKEKGLKALVWHRRVLHEDRYYHIDTRLEQTITQLILTATPSLTQEFLLGWIISPTDDTWTGAWFFNPNLPIFQGIALTHQPSSLIEILVSPTPLTDIPTSRRPLFRDRVKLLGPRSCLSAPLFSSTQSVINPHRADPSLYGAILRFRGRLHFHWPFIAQWTSWRRIAERNPHFHISTKIVTD